MMTEMRKQLVQIRKEKGMTQECLANKLAIDTSCLSKWERGVNQIPLDHLPRYAQALGLKITFNAAGTFEIQPEGGSGSIPEDYQGYSVQRVKKAMATADQWHQNHLATLQKKWESKDIHLHSASRRQFEWTELPSLSANDYSNDQCFYLSSQQAIEEKFPSLVIQPIGDFEAMTLDLSEMLEAIRQTYSLALMKEVEKAIYFTCAFEYKGFELLEWAFHFSATAQDVLKARTLFPYVSEEGLNGLLEIMNQRSWVQTHTTYAPTDLKFLMRLGLALIQSEKGWTIYWSDADQPLLEYEEALSLNELDEALTYAEEEWSYRYQR